MYHPAVAVKSNMATVNPIIYEQVILTCTCPPHWLPVFFVTKKGQLGL